MVNAGRMVAIVLWCVLAIMAALQSATSARAAKHKMVEAELGPPMRFAVVRSASPGCEPFCPEWISAEGAILRATPAEFKKFLRRLGSKRLPVIVTSPGGQVDAAWELGRMIRARKLDIGVGLTRFVECGPGQNCKLDPARKDVYSGALYSSGAYCASACSMMFAGGVRRYVGQWAYMGVHQVTSYVTQQKVTYRETYRIVDGKKKSVSRKVVGRKTVSSYTTTKMRKSFRTRMLAYLKEMGVKQAMYEAGQSTPAADMRQLAPVEMLDMNLVTGLDGADVLVSIENCKGSAPAANCVLAPGTKQQPGIYPKPIVPEAGGMWFAVVRSREAGCEPICPEWISAEGDIDSKTLPRLQAMLQALGARKLPLVVSSRGGDVETAIAMGELIRKHGLDVAVGSTVFAGCGPRDEDCIAPANSPTPFFGNAVSSGGGCTRDCMLILAAGTTRVAGYGTLVGWHYTDTPSSSVLDPYLQQMGVQSQAFDDITPARLDDPDQARFVETALLTRNGSVDLLIDGGVCDMRPMPANCRLANPGEFAVSNNAKP